MIYVIDFGSQTAHLIGRRLRQLGVTVEYIYPEEALEEVKKKKPTGIILSGGPASVYETGAPTLDRKIFNLGIPVLGICYGWQLMAHLLGGTVKSASKEYGPEILEISRNDSIFALPKKKFSVFMSHGDSVTKLPPGFIITASTNRVKNTAVANDTKRQYGVQFHPEAHHTGIGRAHV